MPSASAFANMAPEPSRLPGDGAGGAHAGAALPSRRTGRGRLKVYVGFAPGVGKTYRMLEEAQDLRRRGVDVVLAVVESRGRRETAGLGRGLERVPPRRLEYRGLTATDVDIDAVVARSPRVVVVDEIAHVNAPGCRNQRRYQDVLQILDAGIDVVCAFDVQQLESLREVVQRATGMSVRETVPDSFLHRADLVVSLDLAPEDLIERLRAGKIVSPDQIEPALAGLFRKEILSTLRELALREVANSLDRASASSIGGDRHARQVRRGDRLMVCVSSLSPRASDLLNRGFRLAGRLGTDWALVYVETPAEAPERIGAAAQRQLVETIARARELGASVVRLRATDVVSAIFAHAREAGFGHVMIGRSRGRWWERALGLSRMDRMVREANGLDLHVISFEGDESGR
jgi:two-component system, OmpR family, sensor histidine kinase KdpD